MGGAYDLDELDEEWGPLLQQLDDLLMQVCPCSRVQVQPKLTSPS